MDDIRCDVLVVGTGPGGAIASYYAAEEGADVLMVDKKSVVGVPVRCGEGLPGTLLDDFDLKRSREWLSNRARAIKLFTPKGKCIEFEPGNVEICVLNRDRFEQMLVARAERKGVRVMLRTTAVSGETKGGGGDGSGRRLSGVRLMGDTDDGEREEVMVRPKVVIGADGVESRVGRWVGIDTRVPTNDIGTCAQHLVEHEDIDREVLEFYFGDRYTPRGYAWVFPKAKGLANVGVGLLPTKGLTPTKALEGFMAMRVKGGRSKAFMAGCVPLTHPVKESVRGNVLLVGDAARQVIPLTGAGVANAFVAGRIAGRKAGAVASGRKDVGHLMEYDAEWRHTFEKKILRSYKYKKKVVGNDRKLNRFLILVKMALGLYNMAPAFFGPRLLADFHYTRG